MPDEPSQDQHRTPPPGVNVFFLGGGSVSRWVRPGNKLPSDARAWSWEGLGEWLDPGCWPWGQLTQDEEKANALDVAALQRRQAEAGHRSTKTDGPGATDAERT